MDIREHLEGDKYLARRQEFLVLGAGLLMLGLATFFAVQYLSALLQLPDLVIALAALILVSRRILELEGYFGSRRASWGLRPNPCWGAT